MRERFVGEGMQDQIVVQNQAMEPLAFELALELAADFADIFSVKEHDFALGDPAHAKPLPPRGPGALRRGAQPVRARRSRGGPRYAPARR